MPNELPSTSQTASLHSARPLQAGPLLARTPMKCFYPCLNTRTPPGLLHQLTAQRRTAWSWTASRCQLAQVHRTCDTKPVGMSGGSAVHSSTQAVIYYISCWPWSARCMGLRPSLQCHLPTHLHPIYFDVHPCRPAPCLAASRPTFPPSHHPACPANPFPIPSLCGHLVPDLVVRFLLLGRLGH